MTYGDVIKRGWHKILPQKAKYTKRDLDKVLLASLLDKNIAGRTFTENEARFITVCTAIFYNAKYSKTIQDSVSYKKWKLSKMLKS